MLRIESEKILGSSDSIDFKKLNRLKEEAEETAKNSTKDIKTKITANEIAPTLKNIEGRLTSINVWWIANSEMRKRLKGTDLLGFNKDIQKYRAQLENILGEINQNENLKFRLSKFGLQKLISDIKSNAKYINLFSPNNSVLKSESQKILDLYNLYNF